MALITLSGLLAGCALVQGLKEPATPAPSEAQAQQTVTPPAKKAAKTPKPAPTTLNPAATIHK